MFKKFQLKNGLKVLLIESHKSPVVSIQMWVKTGSADERKGEEGISHFIEHLVFKGTEKYGVGQIASTVEASGGELNAYTSFDQTVFYVTISKQFQDIGLDVIAEMMGFPKFDAAEIDNERGVVLEEIKRSHDSPHRQASRLLFSSLYKKHAYGIPVIGFEKNIETVSRKVLVNYYKSRYNPKTMTLVVAGDFSPKELKPKLEQHFGRFPRSPTRAVKRKVEPKTKRGQVVVKAAPFAETLLHLAFPTPKATQKDIPALEVLALILGQGDSSRLNTALRIENHLVNYAGSSLFVARDPGFFAVSASVTEVNLQAALEGLGEQLVRVTSEEVHDEELKKALTNMASEQYYGLETVDGLARKYGHYQDLFGDPNYFAKFMAQVNRVSKKDVLRVAKRYLQPGLASLIVMSPADAKKTQKLCEAWLKSFKNLKLKKQGPPQAKKTKAKPSKKINWAVPAHKTKEERMQILPLKNGANLILLPNFETPVVSVRAATLGGSRLETDKTRGLTELLSRVWTAGAGDLTEQEMNSRMDLMAASLGAFGGRNSTGLSMTCLRPFMAEMMDLFSLTLVQPTFEPSAIQREVKAMQEQLKLRPDNPAQLCMLQFMKAMFGDHPYGQDPLGSMEGIGQLNQTQLKEIFDKKVGLTIVASGAFQANEMKDLVEKGLSSTCWAEKKLNLKSIQWAQKDQRVFTESAKQQAHVLFGYPGLTITEPKRHVLQVMQSILAGQGGRLFLELRDKASLAYSVSPMRMEGLEGGYFGAYIGCSPEKVTTALKMMRVEFDKLLNETVSADEISRAQRYLIGKHDIELQRNSSITSSILFDEIYGLRPDETFHFPERIRAVTAQDVRTLAQSLFAKPSVVSIVGPKEAQA